MRERGSFEREVAELGVADRPGVTSNGRPEALFKPGAERESGWSELPRDSETRETPAAQVCRKKWETFHANLPDDVKKALSGTDLDYGKAVAVAIHHGLRDVNKLTNMLFFVQWGRTRGYCRITPGEKIPGSTLKLADQWLKFRDENVLPALKRPSPKLPQKGAVTCEKVEIRKADAAPETPAIDLTGTYELPASGKVSAQVLRINQAGTHIEGVARRTSLPLQKPAPHGFFSGDRQGNGNYSLFDPAQPGLFRVLMPTPDGLELFSPGSSSKFVRVKDGPANLNPDFEKFSSRLAEQHEQRPLGRSQIQWLIKRFSRQVIEPFLVDFNNQSSQDRVADKGNLIKSGNKFDFHLRDTFNDPRFGISRLDASDVDLASFYVRSILSSNKWAKDNLTRSHLDWIQEMHSRMIRAGSSLIYGIDWLGMRPLPVSTGQHEYQVDIKLGGGGFFAHVYYGTITFTKLSDNGAWKKGKKESFACWLVGGKGGWTTGFDQSGRVKTPYEWLPQHIPGRINVIMAAVGVSFAGIGPEASIGVIQIEGTRVHPMLTIEFKGIDLDESPYLPPDDKPGQPKASPWDFSIGPGGFLGGVRKKPFPKVDYSTPTIKTDYAAALDLAGDTHFCLNSALLTEDARQALRIMVGKELPAFMSPSSKIVIIGHTDRSKPPEMSESQGRQFNQTLSELRAKNTELAIRDIVGQKLRAKVEALGKGQQNADKAGGAKVNAPFRRVDVILNARLVLSLRA